MTTDNDIIVPEHIRNIEGAPIGWNWRGQQRELVERILNSDKRVVLLQAEPGIGKTTIAWALSQLVQGQSSVLVHTRQLQRQYINDFKEMALLEGRRHYTCLIDNETTDRAPCTYGIKCEHKGSKEFYGWAQDPTCPYFKAKQNAEINKSVILNYAYWLTEVKGNEDDSVFASRSLLVCDEAHDLQTTLMDFDTVTFIQSELYKLKLERVPSTNEYLDLQDWTLSNINKAESFYNSIVYSLSMKGIYIPRYGSRTADGGETTVEDTAIFAGDVSTDFRKLREYRNILTKLLDLPTRRADAAAFDDYVIDRETKRTEVSFRPIYGNKSMSMIKRSADKILLMSAFLAPTMLMHNLRLKKEECEIIDAPPVYNRDRSPFVSLPITKMSYRTSDYEWQQVTRAIDEIIDKHEECGIIIVPSLKLRDTIKQYSRHRAKFITYEAQSNQSFGSLTKDEAIAYLRKANREGDQKILLGQSISTGIDLPYTIGFSIIVKLAYPPRNNPAFMERMKRDQMFQPYMVICNLVQGAGRSKRAEDHDCTTYILDGHFLTFWKRYHKHFPNWFNNYVVDGRKLLPDVVKRLRSKGVDLL